MGDFVGKLFGGGGASSSSSSSAASGLSDDDFADFATPSPATPLDAAAESAAAASPALSITPTPLAGAPSAGPWYAIWERHALGEFRSEGVILLVLAAVLGVHVWGNRRNRAIARSFIRAISPVLTSEFAYIGFDPRGTANTLPSSPSPSVGGTDLGTGPSKEGEEEEEEEGEGPRFDPDKAIKGLSNVEYISYASGRNNIAFMHTTICLQKRNNPIAWLGEYVLSFFFDSVPEPADTVTLAISPFDGAPVAPGSRYDNFVWALVNKRQMRRWRDERYDLSLTRTSDWEGLPNWCAVMGESKEASDVAFSPALRAVVPDCQPFLEYVLVTDQPKDKPTRLAECAPKKRVTLELTLPADEERLRRLVAAFVRLVDHLVAHAHFRPEVTRKVKATREDAERRLRRAEEDEKAEERETRRLEERKLERERKLAKMSAAEQKKFLEKEREKEQRRGMKKQQRKA